MAYLFRGVLLADLLVSLSWFPLACGISGTFLFVSYSAIWQLQLSPSPDHLPSLSSVFLSAALSLYVCVCLCVFVLYQRLDVTGLKPSKNLNSWVINPQTIFPNVSWIIKTFLANAKLTFVVHIGSDRFRKLFFFSVISESSFKNFIFGYYGYLCLIKK